MLRVIETVAEYHQVIKDEKQIGFVPTMGNLHDGHLSLLEASVQENIISVVSIFVNPKQFGEDEDFNNYPRTTEEDIEKISKLEKKYNKDIILFIPKDPSEIYEQNINVNFISNQLHLQLEGNLRPTHFEGVEKVVEILFRIIKPSVAYFGKKDYQQLILVTELAKRVDSNLKVQGMNIVRDKDGLALSSRNQYLSNKEKNEALIISKSLKELKNNYTENKDLTLLKKTIEKIKFTHNKFNYLEMRNALNLSDKIDSASKIVLLANYTMNKINLLDNIELNE